MYIHIHAQTKLLLVEMHRRNMDLQQLAQRFEVLLCVFIYTCMYVRHGFAITGSAFRDTFVCIYVYMYVCATWVCNNWLSVSRHFCVYLCIHVCMCRHGFAITGSAFRDTFVCMCICNVWCDVHLPVHAHIHVSM